MSQGRRFNGATFYGAGWRLHKSEIQKSAKWYRERGYNARIVKERNPGIGNEIGYGLYVHGMQGHPKAQALLRRRG